MQFLQIMGYSYSKKKFNMFNLLSLFYRNIPKETNFYEGQGYDLIKTNNRIIQLLQNVRFKININKFTCIHI